MVHGCGAFAAPQQSGGRILSPLTFPSQFILSPQISTAPGRKKTRADDAIGARRLSKFS